MERRRPTPTGRVVRFGEDEIIVSKTDLKGRIIYANQVFLRVSGFSEAEILGAPHNIVRHPEMPASIFKLLWDNISAGRELFAYVLNLCKNGDEYWVFAHVTPSFDEAGRHVGYHSNRRMPHTDALEKVRPLYAELSARERGYADRSQGMREASRWLDQVVHENHESYGAFVFGISRHTALEAKTT